MLVATIIIEKEGKKEPQTIHLVPELVRQSGMTNAQKKDFRIMKEIACETVINPDKRMGFIVDNINTKINKKIDTIKIHVDDSKVTAFQMDKPSTINGKNSFKLKGDRIMINEVNMGVEFKEWIIVHDNRVKEVDDIAACIA